MKIFKYIFLIIILMSLRNSLVGQIKVGANVGLSSFKEIVIDPISPHIESRNSKMGYGVMISSFVKFPISNRFSIQPEFQFIQKGGEYSTYNFIEIPILVNYRILEIKSNSFLEVGIGTGFGKTIGKIKFKDSNLKAEYLDLVITDDGFITEEIIKYNGFDLDVIMDISYYMKLKKMAFKLGVRGQYDFLSPYYWNEAQKNQYSDQYFEVRNFGIVTYLGISYPIGLYKKD